jgi:threonine aldolase
MSIDLRSDTVTRPTDAMREAAATATVGDDVYEDDPTVAELERRGAETVGKAAALFVPSGTMGNLVATRVHADRGAELLLDREAHIYRWELAGTTQVNALQSRTIDCGPRAVPTPGQIRDAHVAESLHRPGTGLLALENTHNYRGGIAVQRAHIKAAADTAHDLGVPVHLDGARLFNAAVAGDTDAQSLVEPVDTVLFCLSKGLGAPVGSILAGPEAFITEARRARKLFGGGMRQAGLVAAPGIEALESVDRLATDHENARRLATGLDGIPGLSVPDPDTNIVVVDSSEADLTAEALVADCEQRDVLAGVFDEYTTRFTTHRDIDADDIETTIDRIRTVVAEH